MLCQWVTVRSHFFLLLTAQFLSATRHSQMSSFRVSASQHDVLDTPPYPPQKCSACPPGFYTSQTCSRERDTQCSPCWVGSYSTEWGSPRCRTCSFCALNQEVTATCNATSNTKCGNCKQGYYRDPDQVLCLKCSYCYPDFDMQIIRVEQCRRQGGDPRYHCRADIIPPIKHVPRTELKTSPETTTTAHLTTESRIEENPNHIYTEFIIVIVVFGIIFLACIVLFALIITKSYFLDLQAKSHRHLPRATTIEAQEHLGKGFCPSVVNSLHYSNEEVAKRLASSANTLEHFLPPETNACSLGPSGSPRELIDHRDPPQCSRDESADTISAQGTSHDSAMDPDSTCQSSPEHDGRPRAATMGSHSEAARVIARIHSSSELSRTRSCRSSRSSHHRNLETANDSPEDDGDNDHDDDAGGKKLLIAKTRRTKKTAVSHDNVNEIGDSPSFDGKRCSSPGLNVVVSVSSEKNGRSGTRAWINPKVNGLFIGEDSGANLKQTAYSNTGPQYL